VFAAEVKQVRLIFHKCTRAPKFRISYVLWKLSSLKIMDKPMDGYRIERAFRVQTNVRHKHRGTSIRQIDGS